MADNSKFYSIGQGNAQVLPQSNSGIQLLQQLVQRRQLEKQKEDALAQAQLQKLDYNKTREADQDKFINDYRNIQGTYSQLRTTTDPIQRMRLTNALQGQQKDFMHNVNLSQQAMENEKFLGQFGITHANDVKDDYNKQFHNLTNVSVFDPKYQQQVGYFNDPTAPKYDFNKFEKGELLPGSQTRVADFGKNVKQRIGNYSGIAQVEGTDLNKDMLKANITKKALGDKNFTKALLQQFPGSDITGAVDQYANSVYDTNKDNFGRKLKHIGGQFDERPDKFYEHYNYALAHPKAGASATQMSPAQILVTGMKEGQPGTGEKLLSLVPKGQYGGYKPYIRKGETEGEQVFRFPAQQPTDKKSLQNNKDVIDDWKSEHGNAPMDEETKAKLIFKTPEKEYKLNTNADDYHAQVAQMAKDQNINLTQLNQIEAKKGGKGQIDAVVNSKPVKAKSTTTYQAGNKKYTHNDLLKLGYTEDQIKQAIKLGTLKQ